MPNPNPLSVLLGLKQNNPLLDESLYGNTTDAQFASMIPEESLYGAQEEAIQPRGAFTVPSRNSLRDSGVAGLKRTFGLARADAEAKAAPERIKGEYGLAEENIRRETAADNRRAAAEERAAGREFSAGQNALNREAIASRQQTGIDATDQRTRYTQGQIGARQDKLAATPLRSKPSTPGPLSSLYNFFFGPSSGGVPETGDLASQAQQAVTENPGMSFDDMMAAGLWDGVTPAEEMQLRQLIDGQ